MDDKHKNHNMQDDPNAHTAHQAHDQHNNHQMQSGHEEHQHHADDSGHKSEHNKHAGHSDHKDGHDEHAGHTNHSGHEQMFRERFWVSLLLSIPVLLYSPSIQTWLGFSMPTFLGSAWITPILAVIIFFYGGLPFLEMAVPEVKTRKPGMMTLISLAIGVAFIYSIAALFLPTESGFFWELVTLIDIMLLGHWMEMRSVRQASSALDALAKLLPDTAERIELDGRVREVPVASLRKNDLLLVRPGASVPADGEVVEGQSDVNESMITGESLPLSKKQGDQVIAGTINGDGSLRVRVNALGDETALAGIMRLVEQAQQSKSDTQILADKAAGWLFYVALGVAALTGILWTIGYGFNVEVVARVATVLVIACPHALGLAVPLVVAITTSMGAENGILVRDRLALETAREINTVIFDKTGTLTLGEFGVVAIATANGWNESDALALAAAIEGDSEHTIARGIRRTAEVRGLTLPKVSNLPADLFDKHQRIHTVAIENARAAGWTGETE
ncbi:MAG TPA: HAD family hydrolase, partial [Anaerolineales bacterium]|nr:HAD family hydrolase [Anaerolineales bacterium]